MGKRLTKIYTRTGDGGETGLGDGSRVPKTHARVGAMGDIDELNAHLGLVSEHLKSTAVGALTHLAPFLDRLQHRIFDLGGEVSIPGFQLIHDHHVCLSQLDQASLRSSANTPSHMALRNQHRSPGDNEVLEWRQFTIHLIEFGLDPVNVVIMDELETRD